MVARQTNWLPAGFTHEDSEAGHLYYFAPSERAPGPYLRQRHVNAIVDIASDGTLAGVELIDDMPEPRPVSDTLAADLAELRAWRAAFPDQMPEGYTKRREELKGEKDVLRIPRND